MKLSCGALKSFGEKATAGALNRYFAGKPYCVLKEVSLRQVIEVEQSELDPGEWNYYTTAAFDFVVCRKDEDRSWEIVIEFDGPHHKDPLQARKDSLKNRLCVEVDLPIIRVGTEEIRIRENMTFLQYMLDLYFGEKEMERLKAEGKVASDDEFFPGYGFPGSDEIDRRLIMKRGLAPAGLLSFIERDQDVEAIYWYRILDQDTKTTRIEVLRGWKSPQVVLAIERTATITAVNPEVNVPGIHEWHLSSELARFLCLEALEKELDRRGWPSL